MKIAPSGRWRALALLLLSGMLLFFAALAHAENVEDLWLTGASDSDSALTNADGTPIDAIHWYYAKQTKKYYLFLPSCAKTEGLTLWFSGTNKLMTQDGKALQSGQKADWLKAGEEYMLESDTKSYSLVVMQSANLPSIFIATQSGSLEHISSRKGNEEPAVMLATLQSGETAYDGELTQIRGRGNSTFQYQKKGYQLKLGKKTALLGMEKDKTWLLIANNYDYSLFILRVSFIF